MKNTFTKILLCAFALLVGSTAFGAASDEITSVTSSGTTFTIKRTTATYATTVYYRTCNGSAVGGIHFQEKSGSISFAAGQKEATVTITKLSPAETTIDAYDENTDRYFYLEVWNSCTTPKFAKATISSNIYVSRYSIYDKYTEKTPGSYYGLGMFDERDEFEYDFTVFTSQFDATRKKYLAAVGQPYRYAVRCGGWYYKRPYNNYMSPDETYMRLFSEPGGKSAYTGGFKMIRPLESARYFDFPLNDVSDYLDKSTVINPWGHSYSDELTYQYVFTYFTRTINYNKWVIFPATSTGVLLQVYLGGAGSGDALCQPYVFVCLYDHEAPRLMSISVNDEKIYTSGEKIYLSAKFDEIVKVTSSSFTIPVQIGTTTYNFAYEGGSGTNTLYFSASPTLPSSVTTSVKGMVSQQWSYDSYSKITDWTGNQADIYYTAGDITIGQKYTVTLNANSGSINCNDVKYYTYGVGATLPTNVTRTGYTFDGWYTASSGGSKVTYISTTETGNKTYYARWSAKTSTVTFDNQSANSPGTASVTATYASAMPSITVPTRKGYTFGGYFDETNGNGTQYYTSTGTSYRTCDFISATTLYAKWTVKKPTITFNTQSATTSGTTSVTATYGQALPTITVPTRTGYTFGGYYTSTNGSGTQYYLNTGYGVPTTSDLEVNTTLYAKWTVNQYTVTLNSQSATSTGTASVTATYGQAMPSFTKPARTGYTFNGYFTGTSGSGTKYYNADGSSARSYTLTYNTTLYAYWTKDTYTITYNNNGGTISGTPTTTYQYGTSVTLPTISRNGCTFIGWYDNPNCEGTKITSIPSTATGNKTFYAKWTPNEYNITLNLCGGNMSGELKKYIYGVGAILPMASSMSYSGFGFAGWYANSSYTGDVITEITVADYGHKEYWAKWEEGTFPVVLNTNEGVINSGNVVNHKYSSSKPLPTDVTRTGYVFEGWFDNSSCLGTAVTEIPANIEGAVTYWAKWREEVYSVEFEPNGGTINTEMLLSNYTFSVGATLPANVTRDGYSFLGWYDNEDFEGNPVVLIRTTDYGDKTYYANWQKNTYTILFYVNGGYIEDEDVPSTYQYGDEIELPYDVYKDGYSFLGWYDNPNFYNEPIEYINDDEFGNKTFYAKWLVETYGINYTLNGGTINSGNVTSYTYGHGVTLPTDVTRTGYTFGGWYTNSSCTGDRVTSISATDMWTKYYYAKWTANRYSITLYANDGTIRSGNVTIYTFGTTTTLPTDIVREGYAFEGWYVSPNMDGSAVTKISSTESGNKTYYAKWAVKVYTVAFDTDGGQINSGNVASYIYGVGSVLPADVTKRGHTFKGWLETSVIADYSVTLSGYEDGKKIPLIKKVRDLLNLGLGDAKNYVETLPHVYAEGLTFEEAETTQSELESAGGIVTVDAHALSIGDGVSVVSMIPTSAYGNRSFKASWEVNSYPVTFNTVGGTINEETFNSYTFGVGDSLPTNVTRNGYEFAGWYNNSSYGGVAIDSITPNETGEREYWAKWNVNTYTVEFDANGGTINEGEIATYTYGVATLLPTNVTKEGYTFAGWFTTDDFSDERVSMISTNDMGNKTYYANWTIVDYTITYNIKGGVINGDYAVGYNVDDDEITLPDNVTRTGYDFAGWYDNSNYEGDAVETIADDATGNREYWAKWLVKTYSVTLNANEGTINSGDVTTYTYGYGATLPTEVSRTGYTFAGWYNADNERVVRISEDDFDNKEFTAQWTPNKYTITFVTNDGTITGDYPATYTYGIGVELPETITKIGYAFRGWYDNSNFDGDAITAISITDLGNKMFWAKWERITYTVALNTNEGTIKSGNITSYSLGATTVLPTEVVKTGYTFEGWYDNAGFEGERVTTIAADETGNKSFFAQWAIINYTVTYNANGGTSETTPQATYNYGNEVELPTLTREGYTFAGWFDNSNYEGAKVSKIENTETGDKEFWARWSVNFYKVTFATNDGTINSGNIAGYVYGNGAVLPQDITKTGYTFDGWYDNPSFSGSSVVSISYTETGDKTFYAKWTANQYSITFNVNGGKINGEYPETYNYGESVALPLDVERTGYTFGGWYTNSNGDGVASTTISASDLGNKIFWAKWEINTYTVSVDYDKSAGYVSGAGLYNHNRRAVLSATSDGGYEFVGWTTESTSDMLNGVNLKDSTIQFAVTEPISLTANFTTKEYVYAQNQLTIDTLMTNVQNAPIDLAGFFKSSKDGEIYLSAVSTNPSLVVAEVVDGKLFLTTNSFRGDCEVVVTAKLANNERATLRVPVVVEYDCDITIADVAITNVSCYGLADGKIELTAAEDAEYSYQWINSESTANVLENVPAGNYQVVITDEHLCEITKTYTVSQPDEIIATINEVVKPKCNGTDGAITVSASGNYEYLWSNNTTEKDLANAGIGDYTLKVTDPANGCFITLEQTLEYPANPVITVESVEKTRCDQQAGAVIVSVDNEVSYQWTAAGETISTEQNLTNVAAGIYTLTVTDENNCSSSETVEVKNFEVQVPQISLVTVSRQTGKNLIVWVRENTDLIDYYTIYRESANGEYDSIGTVNYTEISVFEDDEEKVDPMNRAWSYKITATDICGNETEMSEAHTTLHLGQSPSLRKGYAELDWQPYVGVDYRSFYIVRETTVGSYTFIDTVSTVPASKTTYTAEIPTVGKTLFYVGIKLNEVIDPKDFMKAESGPFALALSNIAEAENNEEPEAIETIGNNAEVYAIGHTIYVNNAEGAEAIVYDIKGQKIATAKEQDNYEFSIRIDGIYLVKVGGKTVKVVLK